MIEDAMSDDGLDIETYRDSINIPGFQTRLLAQLRKDPNRLRVNSESIARLLRLAYAGHSHLDWVAYTGLTYGNIAATLESNELQDARALSICIDDVNDSPTPLFKILARCETIQDLCFLQGPTRINDDKSSQLFSLLCASPYAASLLESKNITLTCAFSAPLCRNIWLPRPTNGRVESYASLVRAFPVQHMFLRQQFVGDAKDDGEDDVKMFRPCHFFLGDSLLKPQRFVAGFFQYCLAILSDRFLFSFADACSSVSPPENECSGRTISPIPAENLAIPEWCAISSPTATPGRETQVECWPMVRVLQPNSWVLVVSHEWYTTPETRRERAELVSLGLSTDSAHGIPIVRYAFVRARKHIDLLDMGGLSLEAVVQREYFEVVGGVKEFLRETVSEFDEHLVDACFKHVVGVFEERWRRLAPGSDTDFISLLDESTARSVLLDFLKDGAFVRENLKIAMQDMPEGKLPSPIGLKEAAHSIPPKRNPMQLAFSLSLC